VVQVAVLAIQCAVAPGGLGEEYAGAAVARAMPYMQPELDLELDMSKVKTKDDAEAAIKKALDAGARPDSEVVDKAQKILKAAAEDGSVKPGKAPKAKKASSKKPTWGRTEAKTHWTSTAR